jgi:hypothetical protein
MIQLSVNAKKELNRGADQILGDGRIVIGMERDNHKEIENCQNLHILHWILLFL